MTMTSWIATSVGIPAGGLEVTAEYRSGQQSSYLHLPYLNPILGPLFGGTLYPGSLNFHAADGVAFPDPYTARANCEDWWFVPVVIDERAVGVAARTVASGPATFIEVFAREQLAPRLGLIPRTFVRLRLLSGRQYIERNGSDQA
jgi:hypothetical protein